LPKVLPKKWRFSFNALLLFVKFASKQWIYKKNAKFFAENQDEFVKKIAQNVTQIMFFHNNYVTITVGTSSTNCGATSVNSKLPKIHPIWINIYFVKKSCQKVAQNTASYSQKISEHCFSRKHHLMLKT
jgi:hypothetical protein